MQQHDTPQDEPSTSADLDKWLRRQLGRRANLALIAADVDALGRVDELIATLQPYSEISIIRQSEHSDDLSDVPVIQALQQASREDADVVLIWTEMRLDLEATASRLRRWLARAEELGLCDRAFLALIGPHITKSGARSLGYEDGIPSPISSPQLAMCVAREALARDELRRRGSSPPCYL